MKLKSMILGGALAAALLTACVDRSAINGTKDHGGTPSIVITQPANKESIAPVVEALRESLNRVARATRGARVPNPHISILLPDGKTLDVPAPKVGNAAFGDATPKARQTRMEGHLNAVAEKLAAGCTGQSVPGIVVKQAPTAAFKDGGYEVWAAGGGASLWTAKETPPAAPARFIEDREDFTQLLADESKRAGGYLILTDSTGAVPSKIASKKTAGASGSKSVVPVSGKKPLGTAAAKRPNSDDPQVQSPSAPPRPGDTISINVSYPEVKDESKSATPATATASKRTEPMPVPQVFAVKLPDGVEPIGAPILFAPGSAKLTDEGCEAIRKAAASLKSTDGTQLAHVFLVGSADSSLDEKFNKELSEDRANTVRAALLALGITVERTYPIGENLSPDKATSKERASHRFVQMYVLRSKETAAMKLTSRVP